MPTETKLPYHIFFSIHRIPVF